LRESVQFLASIGKRGEEARSRWELGKWLQVRGRVEEAQAELAEASRLFRALGLAEVAARVEEDAG
jgi:hypothetical protein